jgi:F0F1-type ATP synthase membrane subunit b/b'
MTTNDDLPPRRPDETGPAAGKISDEIDLIDESVARITDAQVNEHLRRVLRRSGYIGQPAGHWAPDRIGAPLVSMGFSMGTVITPEQGVIADLVANARTNARLAGERLQQAEKALEDARRKAEEIVAASREEADRRIDYALKQAAEMLRAAREQSGQIITGAHREAENIIAAAQDSRESQMQSRWLPTADFEDTSTVAWNFDLGRVNPGESWVLPTLYFSPTDGGNLTPVRGVVSPRGVAEPAVGLTWSSSPLVEGASDYIVFHGRSGREFRGVASRGTIEALLQSSAGSPWKLARNAEKLPGPQSQVRFAPYAPLGKIFIARHGMWDSEQAAGHRVFVSQAKSVMSVLGRQRVDTERMARYVIDSEYLDLLIDDIGCPAGPDNTAFISAVIEYIGRYHGFPESTDSLRPDCRGDHTAAAVYQGDGNLVMYTPDGAVPGRWLRIIARDACKR